MRVVLLIAFEGCIIVSNWHLVVAGVIRCRPECIGDRSPSVTAGFRAKIAVEATNTLYSHTLPFLIAFPSPAKR